MLQTICEASKIAILQHHIQKVLSELGNIKSEVLGMLSGTFLERVKSLNLIDPFSQRGFNCQRMIKPSFSSFATGPSFNTPTSNSCQLFCPYTRALTLSAEAPRHS